jgi:hypothetical protein
MMACQDNSGVVQELLNLKKDKKDIIPWGETYSIPIVDSKVCHIG